MKKRLNETIAHLREDVEKVDEPQIDAMFETSAEVLGGLVKAFSDYEQKNESARRKSGAVGRRITEPIDDLRNGN